MVRFVQHEMRTFRSHSFQQRNSGALSDRVDDGDDHIAAIKNFQILSKLWSFMQDANDRPFCPGKRYAEPRKDSQRPEFRRGLFT